MGSEEDVLNAYGDYCSEAEDADSCCSGDCYSESEDADSCCSDEEGSDYGLPDEDLDDRASVFPRRSQGYTVLSKKDIRRCQKSDIQKVVSVLSVSEAEASILLCSYKWDVNTVKDEWFNDEERVRRAAGLLEKPVVPPSTESELLCGICFDLLSRDNFDSAACGHFYCTNCWRGYINAFVSNGAGCLMLRCPDPSCVAAIGQDMINKLASYDDKKKYNRFFLRSYVEDNRERKWCPAPGCDFAIAFSADSGDCDVSCRCLHTFCWKCGEEAHSPLDCGTAAEWLQKNRSGSENINWIIVNTKPCPRCQRPIEKSSGCRHMLCPCKHQFCWLCLGPWSNHYEFLAGEVYDCSRYKQQTYKQTTSDFDERWDLAKMSLDRYVHHHERWSSNQSLREKAIQDLELTRTVHLPTISFLMGTSEQQLSFIIDAWQQIINGRRFLRWSYAYGYYMPQDDLTRREFFKYLQGEAESSLEILHGCTTAEVTKFCDVRSSKEDLACLQTKLTHLTKLTKNNFENLARALENGLADVESKGSSSKETKGRFVWAFRGFSIRRRCQRLVSRASYSFQRLVSDVRQTPFWTPKRTSRKT